MKKMKASILISSYALFAMLSTYAQKAQSQESNDAHERAPLILDFPLLDVPFNSIGSGFEFPSMRQSLSLSTNFYQGVHFAIGRSEEPTLGPRLGIALFDLVTATLPLSSTWLHEEWHRAVMSRRKIGSYNDTYNFPIGQSVIAVSHVRDEDLERLKRDHPAEQARLSTAGIESQYEQNLLLEKRRFFFQTPSWDKLVLWMNHVNNIFYLQTCASGAADSITEEENEADGVNLLKRDFTGLDCTAWVYDLYRPDEPYSARGPHPSGVGINRYRKFSDLSEEEKSFLRLQANLSLINLLDPFLIYFDEFQGGIFGYGDKWNLNLRHHITSFGYSIEGNLFLKQAEKNWLFKLQNFVNAVRYFPGLSAELIRYPLSDGRYNISAKANVWLQPRNQRVKSTEDDLGALASVELGYPISKNFETHWGLEAKTDGWVAGNVYLDRNFSSWVGATLIF